MEHSEIYDVANNEQMENEGIQQQEHVGCTRTITRCSQVCTPLRLCPVAHVGEPTTRCCGRPEVVVLDTDVRQNGHCGCEIIVKQCVCVSVPITYCASMSVQPTQVMCMDDDAMPE